jgi:hypothetical protein
MYFIFWRKVTDFSQQIQSYVIFLYYDCNFFLGFKHFFVL